MLGPVHCGLLSQAPLLPKLRGYFAEFLNNASPVSLRILSSSTCVGLRYGYCMNDSGFSRHSYHVLRYFPSLRFMGSAHKTVFPASHLSHLHRASLSRLTLPPCVPTVLSYSSTGISTCCPSATPLGLALGPDLPRADQLYPGILGYSAWRIPTSISLLIPAFSLPAPPPPLAGRLRRRRNAPLPVHMRAPRGFGGVFQPRTFSARGLSASGLLRTL